LFIMRDAMPKNSSTQIHEHIHEHQMVEISRSCNVLPFS